MSDQAQSISKPERAEQAPLRVDPWPEKRSLIDEVMDYAKDHPVATTLAITALSVAGFGAARMALAGRLGLAAAEADAANVGLRAASPVVHLTTPEAADAILQAGRIGGRWGVFAVDAAQVPTTQLGRMVNTLVARNLSAEIEISGEAANAFKSPPISGPFSMARRLAGVKSTPLGSIDLTTNKFVANEIFSNGAFRQATSSEIAKYQVHQWILDYGIDSELYLYGAAVAGVREDNALNHRGLKRHD